MSRLYAAAAAAAALALGLLAPAGCGDAPAPAISAVVRMDAQYRDEVTRFEIYVFGPRLTNGILVPCTSLMNRDPVPGDARLEVLASDKPAWTGSGDAGASLEVPAGSGRVVYVTGCIGTEPIVHGCEQDIEVVEGEVTPVRILLEPL